MSPRSSMRNQSINFLFLVEFRENYKVELMNIIENSMKSKSQGMDVIILDIKKWIL
jgi:hypothetical protein